MLGSRPLSSDLSHWYKGLTGVSSASTLQTPRSKGAYGPEFVDPEPPDLNTRWTSAVLGDFSLPENESVENFSIPPAEDSISLDLIASLVSKPVPPEVFSEWVHGGPERLRYLTYLLIELKRRFGDASIEIEYRRSEQTAPLRIYIYGKGNPEEEAELLWELEDELLEKGLYPLDFGVSIVDL